MAKYNLRICLVTVMRHTLAVAGCILMLQRRRYCPLRPVICVDNDTAGKAFIERLKTRYNGNGIMTRLPEAPFKDWNEQLVAGKNRMVTLDTENI